MKAPGKMQKEIWLMMNDTSNDKASTACIFINTQISERLSNPTVTPIFFFLFLHFFEFEMCLATTWRETNGNRRLDVLIDVGARGSTHGGFVDASRNARLPFSRRPFANRPRRWPLRFLLCRIYRISGLSIRCWRQFRQTILVRSGLVDGNPRRGCWRQPPGPRHAQ